MTAERRKKQAAQYEPGTLAAYAITGILLIAVGVVSLLSIVGGLRGALFTQVKWVMQGLAGGLCIGLSLLVIATGVLVAFSSSRSMPKRGIVLISIFYFAVLAFINLTGKVGQAYLFDYLAGVNRTATPPEVQPEGFVSIVSACFRICGGSGAFGGALGMLLAWPTEVFLNRYVGMVIMALICLTCVVLFSRFDVRRLLHTMGSAIADHGEARRQKRAQAEEQRRLEEEARQRAEDERLLKTPAYTRRGLAGNPAQPAQPAQPYPPYGSMLNQNTPQPAYAAPVQQPELYDEIIVPEGRPLPWQKRSKKADPPAAQPIQTRMTFTPAEMGYAPQPAEQPIEPQAEPAAEGKTELRKRAMAYIETVRRRKVDAGVEAEEVAPPSFVPMPSTTPNPAPNPAPEVVQVSREPYKRPASPPSPQTPPPPPPERQKEPYVYPAVDLLNPAPHRIAADTSGQDAEDAAKLEKTLESFGIPARVQRVTHGPAVTRFELGLVSSGINSKRVSGIADNIAMEMAANGGVRVEAPIKGTNLFGIEIPNKQVQSVAFSEVLLSPEMCAAKSPLAVALGKDIAGQPVICDIAKMPHLLIAGQTGSGKSVCVNAIINSILYRATPEEVRMIMIDPKVVELQCYNCVPHLLIPVVSDPHKAAGALAWAVAEMMDRYHKMTSRNAREFSVYNSKLGPDEEKLPRILIIIDELADLMMACKKDVEASIIRLAQLSRAAGMHIIVATQRPTVDVVTGLIKTNIPSRIAFAMSSSVDSRTILDQNGAEQLLGRGDMIYLPTGANMPLRVQGCYLSDAEIERVVEHIGQHSHAAFDPGIIEAIENDGETDNPLTGDEEDSGPDELLPAAIEMVIADGQASISMMQRRMKIGYARAGRLIDDMAARGIISRSAGSKPREVLISREEYESMKDTLLKP